MRKNTSGLLSLVTPQDQSGAPISPKSLAAALVHAHQIADDIDSS